MKLGIVIFISLSSFSNFKTMTTKVKVSVQEQIKEALDGRTQRWLSLKMQIPEDTLSKKMLNAKGYEFTDADIQAINDILSSSISK